MSDTSGNFELPYLQGAQSQKHVTVNEALARVDAGLQLTLQSASVSMPPDPVPDGAVFLVPAGGVNAWSGQDGKVALGLNGGWVFLDPKTGWRAWVADTAQPTVFDGVAWLNDCIAISPGGAETQHWIIEFDHSVVPGVTNNSATVIPGGTQVIGVTGRVIADLTGTASTWAIGVSASFNRYANNLGKTAGASGGGVSSWPTTYWSDTPVLLTAQGGDFDAGTIRLAIHLLKCTPPRSV